MNIFLVHDPENCDINYEFNIVGHVHDKWKFKRFRRGFSFTDCCNVSVEQWNYQPVTIVEIFQELAKWRKENGFTSH
jgi:calcineurin-like phosphoesterase family protein